MSRKLPSVKYQLFSLYALSLLCAMMPWFANADDAQTDAGLKVYKKANCMGCHKWHGMGGGGYGGAARSLRDTELDAAGLALLIRCGRPTTGMPYHLRGAYKGESKECYGATAKEFGDTLPPKARSYLRDTEIDSVVTYVLEKIKGKGEPTKEQCVGFWGKSARQCD